MRMLEWHDIDVRVWVERVECTEFADGRKIHQQAFALEGYMEMRKDRVRHGQIHCQRSSSLCPIDHG